MIVLVRTVVFVIFPVAFTIVIAIKILWISVSMIIAIITALTTLVIIFLRIIVGNDINFNDEARLCATFTSHQPSSTNLSSQPMCRRGF